MIVQVDNAIFNANKSGFKAFTTLPYVCMYDYESSFTFIHKVVPKLLIPLVNFGETLGSNLGPSQATRNEVFHDTYRQMTGVLFCLKGDRFRSLNIIHISSLIHPIKLKDLVNNPNINKSVTVVRSKS
jgi:hypothetical protein